MFYELYFEHKIVIILLNLQYQY